MCAAAYRKPGSGGGFGSGCLLFFFPFSTGGGGGGGCGFQSAQRWRMDSTVGLIRYTASMSRMG